MTYSISETPPEGFHPTVEVASCYCICDNEILLVLRHPNKPQGETWGVPAGKLDPGESPRDAVIREVSEEVGLDVESPKLKEVGILYIRLDHVDYIYHMFHYPFDRKPELTVAPEEHLEGRWVTFDDAYHLPLIIGGAQALDYFRKYLLRSS